MPTSKIDEYIGARKAAEKLGVHPITLYGWVQKNWIPSVRIGPSLLRFYIKDIEALAKAVKEKKNIIVGNLNNARAGVIAKSFPYPSRRPK